MFLYHTFFRIKITFFQRFSLNILYKSIDKHAGKLVGGILHTAEIRVPFPFHRRTYKLNCSFLSWLCMIFGNITVIYVLCTYILRMRAQVPALEKSTYLMVCWILQSTEQIGAQMMNMEEKRTGVSVHNPAYEGDGEDKAHGIKQPTGDGKSPQLTRKIFEWEEQLNQELWLVIKNLGVLCKKPIIILKFHSTIEKINCTRVVIKVFPANLILISFK